LWPHIPAIVLSAFRSGNREGLAGESCGKQKGSAPCPFEGINVVMYWNPRKILRQHLLAEWVYLNELNGFYPRPPTSQGETTYSAEQVNVGHTEALLALLVFMAIS